MSRTKLVTVNKPGLVSQSGGDIGDHARGELIGYKGECLIRHHGDGGRHRHPEGNDDYESDRPQRSLHRSSSLAVDEATQARLYRPVRERLAETTVFSIGHRATLFRWRRWLTDRYLRASLEVVGLTELAGRLDEAAHWALQLSPGEQQRIAFARALVQKPEWLSTRLPR